MKFPLPKIYPISDRVISGLSHLEQVRRFIEGGARLIQLRDKTALAGDFFSDALSAVEHAHERGVKILINDRVDIARSVRADGVHLGQDDLPPIEARKVLGADAIIGFSTHSVEQAKAALEQPIDYVAIGPVFATATKADPDPVVGLAGIRTVREAIGDFPLVAIGGIDRNNVRLVLEAGADSAAIISDLLGNASEITERMQSFLHS